MAVWHNIQKQNHPQSRWVQIHWQVCKWYEHGKNEVIVAATVNRCETGTLPEKKQTFKAAYSRVLNKSKVLNWRYKKNQYL